MKRVVGFEKWYSVTEDGKVFSHHRDVWLTPYDALFDKVMNNKDTALSFPADKFNSVRSAAERYLVNKNLQDKYRMRQHKVDDQFTVWFVPGKSRTNQKARKK